MVEHLSNVSSIPSLKKQKHRQTNPPFPLPSKGRRIADIWGIKKARCVSRGAQGTGGGQELPLARHRGVIPCVVIDPRPKKVNWENTDLGPWASRALAKTRDQNPEADGFSPTMEREECETAASEGHTQGSGQSLENSTG